MVVVEAVVLVVGTHLLVQLVQCKIVHRLGSWLFSIQTVIMVVVESALVVKSTVVVVVLVAVNKIASSGLQRGMRHLMEIVVVTKNRVVVVVVNREKRHLRFVRKKINVH